MASDPVKAYSLQQAQQPNTQTDPQLDAVMQSLLIDDSDLKRILKGDLHEYLNQLKQMMVYFQQRSTLLLEYFMSNKQNDNTALLALILKQLQEIDQQVSSVATQVKKYRRYVPYLLVFTPTSVLSNITEKEARKIYRKFDIMITRDELDCADDDELLEDKNFFDGLRIAYYLHVMRNTDGHTFRGLIEEKRTVTSVIADNTQKTRKKVLGIF